MNTCSNIKLVNLFFKQNQIYIDDKRVILQAHMNAVN